MCQETFAGFALRPLRARFRRQQLFEHPERDPDPDSAEYLRWELAQAAYIYEAVPFFVPALTSLGIAGSELPDPELLAELRLPFARIAIFLGADLALPATLVGGEEVLKDRSCYHDDQLEQGSTEVFAHLMPPVAVHAAMLGLYRNYPVCLVGVVVASGPGGVGVDDLAMWFTTTEVARGGVTRRVDPGFLSSARLAPIVHNLVRRSHGARGRPRTRRLTFPPSQIPKRSGRRYAEASSGAGNPRVPPRECGLST
jgi:hypothetical protein